MGLLTSIFKAIFKDQVDQIEKSLKTDPYIRTKANELSKSVQDLTKYIEENIVIPKMPLKIIKNEPLDKDEQLLYKENKPYIDGLVELTREYQRQQEELTKFLDLINNKPAELLRMNKYRDESAFETKEVIQSAREEIEKIKVEYLKKKIA